MTPAYAEGSREPYIAVLIVGLWTLWAAALLGGFVFGRPDARNPQRIPRRLRLASSLVLVLAACAFAFFSDEEGMEFRAWIAIGMTFGFVGDLCMARALPLRQPVLAGMAAFALDHLACIAAFFALAEALGAALPFWPVALAWAAGALLWFVVVWQPATARSMLHRAALPYSLLLASTAGLSTGAALTFSGGAALIALGAALFLLSDLLLAAELFNGRTRFGPLASGDAVWLLYGPGQMLIVFGAARLLTA